MRHMEAKADMPSQKDVAVVTGGNRGIGFEICRQLASSGVTVVLTARDEKRGVEAVNALKEHHGLSNIVFYQLDVGDRSSAARLADFLRQRFSKLDILVNNAGIPSTVTEIDDPESFRKEIAGKGGMVEWLRKHATEPYEKAEECLKTNYHGTKNVTEELFPLLQLSGHGRIVNVSSNVGLLRFFSGEDLKEELNDVDNLSKKRLDDLSELFLRDYKSGLLELHGWPVGGGFSAYRVSKALVNAYTRILAKEHPTLCVNCVHPGYVSTDLSFHTGVLTAEEGARGAIMLALLPKGGMTGTYLNLTEVASFV